MRIDGVYIKNFLSFDTFQWLSIDPHLNIIVGPNGSGKTNLTQVLRMVIDVIKPNPRGVIDPNTKSQKLIWSQSTYRGSNQVPIEVHLDIQFTETWEKNLLSTFLFAALCNDSVIQDVISRLVSKLAAGETLDVKKETEQARLSALLQEQLLSKDGTDDSLLKELEWLFTGRLVVVYRGVNTWTYWYESRPDTQPFRLNLDGFSFYDDSVLGRCLQLLTARQDQFSSEDQLLLTEISSATTKPYLRVEYSPTLLATHQAFQQLAGITLESSSFYGPSFVFYWLLERALVFSDNMRSQPQYTFSYAQLHAQPIDLSSGEQLARYLFLKKNGSQTDRDQYEATQKLFFKITGRSFDVSFDQPAILSASLDEEDVKVVLSIHVSSDWGGISLAFSGAGRIEALFMCTLIASRNEQIIILDEPAMNMHVTMQKALLNEIQTSHDNQYIIVTHSSTLVAPDAILKTSRFFLHQGHTYRAAFDRNSLDDEEFSKLEKDLRRSTDARAVLFSRGVILVEGETEQGVLAVWFEKQFGASLESKDFVMYDVGSDTSFGRFVQYLHQFHIPWTIICDGKVIGDRISSGTKPRILRQLSKAEIPNLPSYDGKDFLQLRQDLEVCGVFTHAEDIDNEIEALQVIKDHQDEARDQVGDSKVRQGQYIATNYDCPSEIARLLNKAIDHLEKQGD
jgi:ABC-type Mn2+/Zn2+ transport system ATPase subunit